VVPGVRQLGGDFTVMGFFDHGESKINRKPLATDNPNYRSISGYGVGATLGKEGSFLTRVYAAWSGDREVPQADNAPRTPRFWFHLVKYF
jgi:hypothetical protein